MVKSVSNKGLVGEKAGDVGEKAGEVRLRMGRVGEYTEEVPLFRDLSKYRDAANGEVL